MSFGYGIGDVIAVVNLFERIAQEVQNYRDAPPHFQQLGAELSLLSEPLSNLYCKSRQQNLTFGVPRTY